MVRCYPGRWRQRYRDEVLPVAVPDHVQGEHPPGQVQVPDRVPAPDGPGSVGRYQQHHVLAGLAAEAVQFRRGQHQSLHVRRERGRGDHLELEPPGAGQVAGQFRERVIESGPHDRRQGVGHRVRSLSVLPGAAARAR
jgi:hypothetical protein